MNTLEDENMDTCSKCHLPFNEITVNIVTEDGIFHFDCLPGVEIVGDTDIN